MAEQARGESEKLVVYLLDDFYRELEPVGRLNLVGELAKRAIDYYQALPAELRTPDTERNQALAQVRYGAVLRIQSKYDEARKVLGTAIPALDALRAKGDASEATAIGLAIGLVAAIARGGFVRPGPRHACRRQSARWPCLRPRPRRAARVSRCVARTAPR